MPRSGYTYIKDGKAYFRDWKFNESIVNSSTQEINIKYLPPFPSIPATTTPNQEFMEKLSQTITKHKINMQENKNKQDRLAQQLINIWQTYQSLMPKPA